MKLTLTWQGEEEGVAVVRKLRKEICRILVYVTGESAAELVLEPSPGQMEQMETAIPDMGRCIAKLGHALEKEGLTDCCFVAEEGSRTAGLFHALASAGVLRKAYSEFLLKKIPDTSGLSGTTGQTLSFLQMEDGFLCTGMGGIFSCRLRPYRDGYYLYEVSVREDMRGRGIGTAAMQELLARMGELPKTEAGALYLQVGSYNGRAMRLYGRLGFETETELCYYSYGDRDGYGSE